MYGMSVAFLKQIIVPLYLILACINKCIDQGVFPNELKDSRTVPVHKKGAVDNVCNNYRFISIIPVFAKIFETVYMSSFMSISRPIIYWFLLSLALERESPLCWLFILLYSQSKMLLKVKIILTFAV